MPKLSDTQLVILSAAAQREDGTALPLPDSIKIKGIAVLATLKGLLNKKLLVEQPATRDAIPWRETKDDQRLMLVITDAGRAAIRVESNQAIVPASLAAKSPLRHRREPTKSKVKASQKLKAKALPASMRSGTKQALLVNLLRRKQGATIAEAVKATGWQQHSVRGAISGSLKKKLGLNVQSETVERRGRVYRIKAGR